MLYTYYLHLGQNTLREIRVLKWTRKQAFLGFHIKDQLYKSGLTEQQMALNSPHIVGAKSQNGPNDSYLLVFLLLL